MASPSEAAWLDYKEEWYPLVDDAELKGIAAAFEAGWLDGQASANRRIVALRSVAAIALIHARQGKEK